MAGTPFKMKGFSGFGNSPLKQEKEFFQNPAKTYTSKTTKKGDVSKEVGFYKESSGDITKSVTKGKKEPGINIKGQEGMFFTDAAHKKSYEEKKTFKKGSIRHWWAKQRMKRMGKKAPDITAQASDFPG